MRFFWWAKKKTLFFYHCVDLGTETHICQWLGTQIKEIVNWFLFIKFVIACSLTSVHADGPFQIIRNLLQNNVVGAPVVHQTSEWNFDPEVSLKRREQFQEVIYRYFPGNVEFRIKVVDFILVAWIPRRAIDRTHRARPRRQTRSALARAAAARRWTPRRHHSSHTTWAQYRRMSVDIVDVTRIDVVIA